MSVLPVETPEGPSALRAALDAAAATVGEERVLRAVPDGSRPLPPTSNVSMFRPRDVHGVIRPRTVAEVQEIVRAFADTRIPQALHAVSTGRNWGLGSREPALDGAVTLDLGGLSEVRGLDLSAGWAVVEPGVTQVCLARMLSGTSRMLNVTASSGHTSVLGNALDRGVGLRRQRTEDLAGLEVVLPDGELVRVGWWPQEARATPVNPHGLGPSLLPLFTQSHLGVVTAAVVRLLPRPEEQRVLRLSFGRENLTAAIDELRRWVAQGLVSGVLKVYDTVSTRSYGGQVSDYVAHVCVDGTPQRVEALTGVVLAEAGACGLFSGVARSDVEPAAADDVVAQVVEHTYAGDPSHNEDMLRAAVGRDAERVDTEGGGWLFFLPLIPFSGADVEHARNLLDQVGQETGVHAGCTVNALGPDVIDFVVSFRFPRTKADAERAHHALDRAYTLFSEAGFIPYRLDADHSEWADRLAPDASARGLVRRLKQFLDPYGVIAPGRYA